MQCSFVCKVHEAPPFVGQKNSTKGGASYVVFIIMQMIITIYIASIIPTFNSLKSSILNFNTV